MYIFAAGVLVGVLVGLAIEWTVDWSALFTRRAPSGSSKTDAQKGDAPSKT